MNVLGEFAAGVARWPNDIALVHRGNRIRYGELYDAVQRLTDVFRRRGIDAGQKVGVLFSNSPEHIVATLAILGMGAVVVFLSPFSSASEIAGLADEVGLDAICYGEGLGSYLADCSGAVGDGNGLRHGGDAIAILQWPGSRRPEDRPLMLSVDAAALRFSSGTTGKPKGILNSHRTILARAKVHFQSPPLSKNDAVLWMQPLGRLPGPIAYLLRGAKVVLGDALDTSILKQLISTENVSHVYTVPLFFRTILNDEFDTAGLAGVRYFLSGGTALGQQLADQFSAKFGHEIVEHYGLSETGTVFMNESSDPSKRGSIGLPVRTEVKLLCQDGDCPDGEATGELMIRCDGMFDAYYQPWRLREEVLPDGWFNTGDMARRDADGYYWLVGRTKEMINVAGVKVFPQDIESILDSHDAVDEAIVFAVPNKRFGEVPHAKVKLRTGAICARQDLLRYVNDRLPVFKSLRGLEFVESIPKTITGKLKRIE